MKTLVDRMLKDLIEYGKSIREKMKTPLREIKIHRKPTEKGRKLGFKSMIWNIRNKHLARTKQEPNSKKQGEFKKTLGHLQKGQHPNHRDARRRRGRARN